MLRTSMPFATFALALVLALPGCPPPPPGPDVEPEGRLSVGVLDFGWVELGAKRTLPLEVRTVGGGRLTVEHVVIQGSGAGAFAASPSALDVSFAGSEIEVTFAPLDASEASATLTLVTNSPKTPTLEVPLTGEGYVPRVTVDRTTVDFGALVLGTTRTERVIVSNADSTEPALVRVLEPATEAADDFEIRLPAGPVDGAFLLDRGASEKIDVRFAPTSARTHAARLVLSPCEVCTPVTVSLSGVGVGSGLAVEPASIDFGPVNPGATVTRPITFRNVGNLQVRIDGLTVEAAGGSAGPDPAFSVDAGALPLVLDPGEEATADVGFSPEDDAGHAARVHWTSNDAASAEGDVVVVGRGGGPDIRVADALDFGTVAAGTRLQHEVVVANAGVEDLHLLGFEIEGATAFSIVHVPADLTVPAGGARNVEVAYVPTAAGDDAARLVITSDDADTPEAVTDLRGQGVTLPPCSVELTPAAGLDFGLTSTGERRSLRLAIRNAGTTGRCLVSDLHLGADTSPAFTLPEGRVDGLYLEPGESRLVRVDFLPEHSADYTGTVDLYVSDPARPAREVPLSGTAGQIAVGLEPADADLGAATVGCRTPDREICIVNRGTTSVNLLSLDLVETGVGGEVVFRSLPAGLGTSGSLPIAAGGKSCFTVGYAPKDPGADEAAVYARFQEYPRPLLVTVGGRGAADAVQTDRFVQRDRKEADVLLVIDDSGFVYDLQQSLSANLGVFLNEATSRGTDYHVAVTTPDISTNLNAYSIGGPNVPGLFWPQDGSRPRVVTPDLPDPEAILRSNVMVGGTGDLYQTGGLEAARDALGVPLVDDPAKNGGFLRPDATLSVVFVSVDAEEVSPDTLDTYLAFFRGLKGRGGRELFSASAIVPGPGCGTGSGARYIEMTQRTGGLYRSTCAIDWTGALEDLADAVFGSMTRFFLSSVPASGDLQVRIVKPDGTSRAATGWTHDAAANSVDFEPAAIPEPGDTVEITYGLQCL